MSLKMMLLLALVLLTNTEIKGETSKEKFVEELFVKETPSGHVYSHFQFTTSWDTDIRQKTREHYNLFPRSIGDIIAAYNVQELSLSLTQGLWRYEKWGYPIKSSPTGAQVIARFEETVPDVDKAWEGLTSALAGLLCASLNNLGRSEAIQPEFTFANLGLAGGGLGTNRTFLRYGILPRENLCTENVTPWKKLLPCKNRQGLGVLLSSGHIQKYSVYFSLGLEVKPVCVEVSADGGCIRPGIELVQSVGIVMDPVIMNKQPDNMDWNIKRMFGIGVTPACPLADSSTIFIDTTDSSYQLDPPPTQYLSYGSGATTRKLAVYDVKVFTDHGITDIVAKHPKAHIHGLVRAPPILLSRHVVGTGQERGGIVATIKNSCSVGVTVAYLELIPWYLRVYLHTLRIETDGVLIKPINTVYRPGRDRERPYHVELIVKLPPKSTTVIRLDTEYSILRWTEYPPDANHGLYVGAAVLTTRLPVDNTANATIVDRQDSSLSHLFWGNIAPDPVIQVYSEILLITVPTPDFSMPYNVICLACTIAALAFGPIHNMTTKKLVLVSPDEEEKTLLGKLLLALTSILPFRKKKEAVQQEKKKDGEDTNENDDGSQTETEEISDEGDKS